MKKATMLLCCAGLLFGCGDDEHKGTVSHGPSAQPTTTAPAPPMVRLVYQPKSPVATMRVAEIAKKRLEGMGATIKIGGETIHVDVPSTQAAAAKKAMEGGRIDLWLAAADTLGADAGSEAIPLKSEEVSSSEGPKTDRYLEAPPDAREELLRQAEAHAGKARVLLGPSGDRGGPLRTFLVEPGKTVRGEYVASAQALQHAEGARLVLTFEGSGRNFVRWNSKQGARFVLQADGAAIATVASSDEVKDGSLTFVLSGWSFEDAKKLAEAIDGVALSHSTALEEERAP